MACQGIEILVVGQYVSTMYTVVLEAQSHALAQCLLSHSVPTLHVLLFHSPMAEANAKEGGVSQPWQEKKKMKERR